MSCLLQQVSMHAAVLAGPGCLCLLLTADRISPFRCCCQRPGMDDIAPLEMRLQQAAHLHLTRTAPPTPHLQAWRTLPPWRRA